MPRKRRVPTSSSDPNEEESADSKRARDDAECGALYKELRGLNECLSELRTDAEDMRQSMRVVLDNINAIERARDSIVWRLAKICSDNEFVVCVKWKGDRTFQLSVRAGMTVYDAKQMIWKQIDIPPCYQRLAFSNKAIHDSETLEEHGIVPDSTLDLRIIRGND